MSDSVKMVVVLTAVGLLAGAFLTVVYQKTAPEIERQDQVSLRRAIFVVLPEATDYQEVKLAEDVLYQGLDKQGQDVGWAFLAEGSGFQGKIKLMVGMDQDLNRLQNIEVLESLETPGLGGEIVKDDFKRQFRGINMQKKIELIKGAKPRQVDTLERSRVQAITGATISSKAIVKIIEQRVAQVKKMLRERD